MANANNIVTYEVAAARIGVLPTLAPRPNGRNLRALTKALTEALQGIAAYQLQRYGFMGFVTTQEEYALTGEQPWHNFPDPGYHRTLGGAASEQRDADTRYNVAKNIFQSQENVRQAINKALTAAVPENFRRDGVGILDNGYTTSGPLPRVAPFRTPIAKLARAVAAHTWSITNRPYLDMVFGYGSP